jgi:diadenosine tetraphosphate (Ap4A) HIT family hydrolase
MAAPDCPFCNQLARLPDLPGDQLVGQFVHSVVILGPWQYFHGYCLLVARRHATELNQLPDAERRAYLDEMCVLAQAITDCFHPHKLNYELLGNQVPHLHWHVFPRYRHDPEAVQPVWLALDRAERDPDQRQRLMTGPVGRADTAVKLRRRLQEMGAVTS